MVGRALLSAALALATTSAAAAAATPDGLGLFEEDAAGSEVTTSTNPPDFGLGGSPDAGGGGGPRALVVRYPGLGQLTDFQLAELHEAVGSAVLSADTALYRGDFSVYYDAGAGTVTIAFAGGAGIDGALATFTLEPRRLDLGITGKATLAVDSITAAEPAPGSLGEHTPRRVFRRACRTSAVPVLPRGTSMYTSSSTPRPLRCLA